MSALNVRRRSVSAFTLIELLVVIAIIAILAAILFPVFAKARSQARKTVGLSNLKELGLGTMMYVQDYDETFPYYNWGVMSCSEVGTGGVSISGNSPQFQYYSASAWCNSLQPYIKNLGIFQDPGDKLKQQPGYCINFPQSNFVAGASSWTKSTWCSYGWAESASGKALASFSSPASDVLWGDYGGVLIDAWGRFGYTSDLYLRRTIWSDLPWQTNDIRGLSTPPTDADWQANAFGVRWETGSNETLMDGHAKYFFSKSLQEVGPDVGQVIPGTGSVTPGSPCTAAAAANGCSGNYD